MKYFLLILVSALTFPCYSQDTAQQHTSESWKNAYVPKTLLRFGIGYLSSFYSELGITRRKYSGEDLFIMGLAYYGAVEWSPAILKNPLNIYGIKFGGELTLQPLLLGLEAKFQTDFHKNDIVITPRIGIGSGNLSGFIVSNFYLCYGYNISTRKLPFEGSGKHQFTLIMNPVVLSYLLNRKNYSEKLYK